MSGGFFRGTSADQDTRFSNKQAKLLKTQKFASELDNLVDTTKVKMDIMKPWIATRVTELLGFEDEVLINFIYGLLEAKVVNGKEVQISLTGFMEKHTAKFMKELWTLLLSAQKNTSGVPQQFLDAKEEETRKKKLEADQMANEIQKKKEKERRELDQQTSRNMDVAVEMKATNAASDPNSKTVLEKDSSSYPKDDKEAGERNGARGRTRSFSPDESAVRQITERMVHDGGIGPSPRPREWRPHQGGPETSKEDKEANRARADGDHKSVPLHGRSVRSSMVGKQRDSPVSERLSRRGVHTETFEQQRSLALYEDSLSGDRQRSTYPGESKISEERNFSHKNNGKDSDGCSKSENSTMEVENVNQNNRSDSFDSGSAESDKHKAKIKEKRKHAKHDREEVAADDDYCYDSEIDKQAKRRRKEEKKLRREQKRQRRDERHRRKEERHPAKLKMRNQSDADASDDEHASRWENHPSDAEETESARKRLEIELRNKALESIKVKRNSSH